MAGGCVSAGENGSGVSLCWYLIQSMFLKKLESPDRISWISWPVAEATDRGLKCCIGININISDPEGPACWSSVTRKYFGCPLDCCCCILLATCLC